MPLGQGLRVFLRRCIINQDGLPASCSAIAAPVPRAAPVTRVAFRSSFFMVPVLACCSMIPTSQSPDPILKPLYLRHNQIGVVSAVRHCSHTLKGAKEMNREFS